MAKVTVQEAEEERIEVERRWFRRLAGLLLFPIFLFPTLSLISYNWRDISAVNAPPLTPPGNLIGLAGAWATYIGYSVMGLALWTIPLFVLIFSVLLLYGRILRVGRRAFWMLLFVVALCCLLQLGSATIFAGVLESLNIQPNAGGAIGYWLMTCLLTRWFSPVGGGLLMLSIMFFALLMAIGARAVFSTIGRLSGLWEARRRETIVATEEQTDREAAKENATIAKAAARKAREEERQRTREERAALKQRKAEERAAREQEREEARNKPPLQANPRITERLMSKIAAARQAAAVESDRQRAPSGQSAAPDKASVDQPETAAKRAPKELSMVPPPPPPAYSPPPIELLNDMPHGTADHGDINRTAEILVETLSEFNVAVEVVGITPGPVVTQYELRPAPSVKVERITNLSSNLQMALAAHTLRVLAPIPGKKVVGIEIPNKRACPVTLSEIVSGKTWRTCTHEIPLALGKDVAGKDLICDLAKAPHLLVAGATGSGKSVCLNSIMTGFLMSRTPEQLRLILVDPKRVEFTCYNDLPHLLVPVINEPKKVAFGLAWAIREMENRYRLLQKSGCRNIVAYNNRCKVEQPALFDLTDSETEPTPADDTPEHLPYIVIVMDEVADIMAAVGKEVEPAINRLASLSRAVGIHLILATQRPSVDVITGTIKANIPGRIAFRVSQANDSRTILDSTGAESLIGKGDMLFLQEGSQLMRAQGAWVSDEEITRVVEFVKEHSTPQYDQAFTGRLNRIKESDPDDIMNEPDEVPESDTSTVESVDGAADPLLQNAIEVLRMTRRASTSMVQRKLNIGYTRAARIMDMLEERGIVGPQPISGSREILIDFDNQFPDNLQLSESSDADVAQPGGGTEFEQE